MSDFDHKGKNATAEWLTSVLTRNGYLTSGEVTAVVQNIGSAVPTLTSEFFELTLEYSAGSTGSVPSRCLMKVGKPEMFQGTRKEAAFYELARGSPQSTSLLVSFGTAVDDSAQSAVVLLQDLRNEYFTTEWPIPPTIDACERAVKALAAIHATWWNSPALDNRFERLTDLFPSRWRFSSFFDAFGDGLSKPRRDIVERLLERYSVVLKQRIAQTNAQTMVHGDAHFWNVLLPNDKSQAPIWIDWQTWGVHFGAFDLAYMLGLHWFPERRHRFEKQLLKSYLEELRRRGIDYQIDDLTYDYRLQVAGHVFTPIVFWSMKIPAAVWWPHLDRAFSAFDDLDCHEILQ